MDRRAKTRTIIIATMAVMGIRGETEDGLRRWRVVGGGRGGGILDGGCCWFVGLDVVVAIRWLLFVFYCCCGCCNSRIWF